MNLSLAELAELPLAAAVVGPHDELIRHTPEWQGAMPGAVSYPVRSNRLLVQTGDTHVPCEAVLNRLLDAMDATRSVVQGDQALRVGMLAASLRIIAGRTVTTAGTSHDVIDFAKAGISARTSLSVEVEGSPVWPVVAPEVAALVLVQFAANAERHARVSSITIAQSQNAFHVMWQGESRNVEISSARQRGARDRWGMGFTRIAADTLGGVVYAPYDKEPGLVIATLELGLNRLALPLAVVRRGKVVKATRAWDEETRQVPGREIAGDSKLAATVHTAARSLGNIIQYEGWWARAIREVVWVAVPPDGIVDRARDVLAGIVHERALWDGVPEPWQSNVFACASLLGALLGTPLPRVSSDTWNRKYPELAVAFGVTLPVPEFEGLGIVDPRVAAFLAAEFGDSFEEDGDDLYLHIRADKLNDPFISVFLQPETDVFKLT